MARRWPTPQWAVILVRLALIFVLLAELYVTATVERPDLMHPTTAGDAWTYYVAGQRLNAGHNLYGPLLPGDQTVPRYPAEFPAPLLSPPLVAVIWRPLALLGASAVLVWWALAFALIVGLAILFTGRGHRMTLTGLLGILALGVPFAIMSMPQPHLTALAPIPTAALSGNLNGYLVALCVTVWWATSRGRPLLAGMAAGFAAVLKLGPFALVWWLVVRRDWPATKAFVVTVAILGVIGLVGAGLDANIVFVRLAFAGHIKPTSLSVPWMLETWFHISPRHANYGTVAATLGGLAAVFAARRRPRVSFFVTLLVVIYSSPVVLAGNFVILLAALTPWTASSPAESPQSREPAPLF